jgi:small subunit ribosomal protein S6
MEKKICSYETLFAVNATLPEEECKALVEKFVNLIKDNGSDVEVNEWGKRRFAYPINYINEGYYVLVTYKSNADFPQELERQFGITEGVLRYMTTIKCEKSASKAETAESDAAEETVEVAESTEA